MGRYTGQRGSPSLANIFARTIKENNYPTGIPGRIRQKPLKVFHLLVSGFAADIYR